MEVNFFNQFNNLHELIFSLKNQNISKILIKELSSNDNIKNQIYLGKDFSISNLIPHQEIKLSFNSKRSRPYARLDFSWIDSKGVYEAPNANIILYEKYSEVRLSGFIQNCKNPPEIIKNRHEGRLMFFGISSNKKIYGYVTNPFDKIYQKLQTMNLQKNGIFFEFPIKDEESTIFNKIKIIQQKKWIKSNLIL